MSNVSEILTKSRMVSRPSSQEFIESVFDDFFELHGDRHYEDDMAIVGGIALLEGMPVTVAGIQKGHTVKDNVSRRFGSPNPDGYRKVMRLMEQAEKFNRPVIQFINTSGAYPGKGAEERGQGEAIARCLYMSAGLKVPVISIFIGEGGSGGALAMAAGDRVWMLENSVYSVLSPEGFASILWKDPKRFQEAADVMRLTAQDLYELGVIEKVIKEVNGGCQNDFGFTANLLKSKLEIEVNILQSKDLETLLKERYERFRKFGEFSE